ncbi:hypothetical protein HOD38_05105 [archaeon]|jgi:DNA excision repair protein ERCC-4|nr:hypothetical protein [archaeon]MBT4397618.1 hypothetical protein [archaeon]MBT4441083.1 hypothetical protein [archaeon]
MHLVVDSREQKPYSRDIFEPLGMVSTTKTLKTGDYSILGREDEVAIERKSLQDLIASITKNRGRFERELQRAQNMKFFAVVIEANYQDIKYKKYESDIEPKCIFGTIFKWTVKYNVSFILAGNREGAALATIKMLEGVIQYEI